MSSDAWYFPPGSVVTLRDSQEYTWAEIFPDWGNNCARWGVHWRGQRLELLWPGGAVANQLAPPGIANERVLHPFRFGFPILFPFPNRIRGGLFFWDERKYQLPINDPQQRNAIHGLVGDVAWSVSELPAQQHPMRMTARFQLAEHAPDRRSYWPSDFALTVTWQLALELEAAELAWAELSVVVHLTNCGVKPLPFGLGFHPYFAVPADDAEISVLSAQPPGAALCRWELHELLPTGRLLPLRECDRRLVQPGEPMPLPPWDDAFRLLPAREDDPLIIWLRDRRRGFSLRVQAPSAFRDLVLFVPPHRQAVCIEPYTCVTDAINLHHRGIASGLRVLMPGQVWTTELRTRFVPG
ncbi:MAG: aldose 1-epimerase [Gemmatales bacterium]|nr:aldose 1-epimerase [Gemmatales bacterium]